MTQNYINEIETTSKIIPLEKGKNQLVLHKPKLKRKIVQNIHDEDVHIEHIDKIIQRDFFPDLDQLRTGSDYLDAVEKKDAVRMRQLQIQMNRVQSSRPGTGATTFSAATTPSTFETPVLRRGGDEVGGPEEKEKKTDQPICNPEKKECFDVGLDAYLARNTSEDNASFAQLLEEAENKRRTKMAWCYDKAAEFSKLPSIEYSDVVVDAPLLAIKQIGEQPLSLQPPVGSQEEVEQSTTAVKSVTGEDKRLAGQVDTWPGYRVHNHVMFPPEGAPLTPTELADMDAAKREVVHANTRFRRPVGTVQEALMKQRIAARGGGAAALVGRVGPDGKELHPSRTPGQSGFQFVDTTPSPMPGAANETPLMTWGEVESTPFRLSGRDTPQIHGGAGLLDVPSFKMAAFPERDRLGMALAEKASKEHRAKKERAVTNMRANLRSPSARLATLSPAAQRLFSSKLQRSGRIDSSLRATYSPSPARNHRPPSSSNSRRSSSRSSNTPVTNRKLIVTPGNTPIHTNSITDDLLNLTASVKRKS